MTNSLNLYEKLLNSEPLGFIDPLTDLGEFDKVQMKFRKPVRSLTNKYSGQPYNPYWQEKIEEMRLLYIQYQLSLREEDKKENIQTRVKVPETQEHIEEIVTMYLKLGFRFREIEKRVSGYGAKQELVEQLTIDWLSFMNDEKAVTSERQAGDH